MLNIEITPLIINNYVAVASGTYAGTTYFIYHNSKETIMSTGRKVSDPNKKTRKAHAQAKLSSPSEHISFFTIIKTQVTWHGLTLYALNKSFPVMKNY